jgi:hypothetical protein
MSVKFCGRWFRGVVAVLVSASFIALPGCGGSQSTKVTMPNKTYDPPAPDAHKDFGGRSGPKRAMK